jgi:hypothetical protein
MWRSQFARFKAHCQHKGSARCGAAFVLLPLRSSGEQDD